MQLLNPGIYRQNSNSASPAKCPLSRGYVQSRGRPAFSKEHGFLGQILSTLKTAEVDAFINLTGVEASVGPTGQSNRGVS